MSLKKLDWNWTRSLCLVIKTTSSMPPPKEETETEDRHIEENSTIFSAFLFLVVDFTSLIMLLVGLTSKGFGINDGVDPDSNLTLKD